MFGDLPQYAWHVRGLPCEDIAISVQEVNELAFLFGQELGPDPYRLGWVSGVDPHRLGFLEWAEDHRGGWFVAVWDCWGQRLPEPWELRRVDDHSGKLIVLAVAQEGMREGAAYGDDAVRSWHLQLEVGVVGDCHEPCVAWPPQDGMVGPWKVYHLKGKDL